MATTETTEQILERYGITPTSTLLSFVAGDPLTEQQQEEVEITKTTYGYSSPYWLSGYTFEGEETRYFRYQAPKEGNIDSPVITTSLKYRVYSSWEAKYNPTGAVIYRKDTENTPWGPIYKETTWERSETGGVEREVKTEYEYLSRESLVEACGFPGTVVPPLPGDIRSAASTLPTSLLKSKTVTTTVARNTEVISTLARSTMMIFTADGAANIQVYMRSYTDRYREKDLPGLIDVGLVLDYASRFVFAGSAVSYSRKAPGQKLSDTSSGQSGSTTSVSSGIFPVGKSTTDIANLTEDQLADLINSKLATDLALDPEDLADLVENVRDISEEVSEDNGFVIPELDVTEIDFSGSGFVQGTIREYTPPYLPDDEIVVDTTSPGSWIPGDCSSYEGWTPDPSNPGQWIPGPNASYECWTIDLDNPPSYKVKKNTATQAAKAFSKTQVRLERGYNAGQAVVYPVQFNRVRPFSPIYLSFGGIVGQYRTNSTSIVFDQTGILVSTDAIFWGGVGQ